MEEILQRFLYKSRKNASPKALEITNLSFLLRFHCSNLLPLLATVGRYSFFLSSFFLRFLRKLHMISLIFPGDCGGLAISSPLRPFSLK